MAIGQWDVDDRVRAHGAAGLWRCLDCGGVLAPRTAGVVTCESCAADFPEVAGIPDLRARGGASFDADADLEDARRFHRDSRDASLESVMRQLCDQPGIDDATRAFRVTQVMESPRRLRRQFDGWLRPCLSNDKPLLDVGCGSGGLLAELAACGHVGAGIDASMTMLVAAKRMIESQGGIARLACAYAEALPIASASLGAVTMYDAIEHVQRVDGAIAEACRVLEPGGHLAISTPNRFSLAAEPHVFLWGVGWLPRPLQVPYVRWRNGLDYRGTQLLSTREMARQLRQFPGLQFEFHVPQVPLEEIEHFSRRRAVLARLYNRVAGFHGTRWALLAIGPFFQVVARRVPTSAAADSRGTAAS